MWTLISHFLVVLCCVWVCNASNDTECTNTDTDKYWTQVLLQDNTFIEKLAVDWNANKIFLMKKLSPSRFKVIGWNIDDGTQSILEELPFSCAFTVDQHNSDLYAGCRNNGLFLYDRNLLRFVRLTDRIEHVGWLHFADKLYYTDAHKQLHTYEHGHRQIVPELQNQKIRYFVIDSQGDWIFVDDDNNVMYQKANTTRAVQVMSTDDRSVSGINVDPHGNVYGMSWGRFYYLNSTGHTATDMWCRYCHELAFDKDSNPIFFGYENSETQMVRLLPCKP